MQDIDQNHIYGTNRNGRPAENRNGSRKSFALGAVAGAAAAVLAGIAVIAALQLRTAVQGADNPVVDALLGTSDGSAVNSASLSKLKTLEQSVERNYYYADEVTQEDREEGIYKGLIDSLGDAYSVYYTQEEMEELTESLTGQYCGIGAYLTTDKTTGYPAIAGVMEDSPAQKAGLQAGDIIYEVDGEDTGSMDLDTVVSRVRGEEGTAVTLTIVRSGAAENLTVEVERAVIDSPTVSHEVLEDTDQIGYISISSFDTVTTDQFTDALQDLYDQNIRGLIIDLRGNPGGNVDVVTAIADEILPEGLVFYMEDRDGKRTEYACDGENEIQIPLAVLVNGSSASASEILSGAVQDAGIGTIVGTQTYGKGVVQTVYTLRDGSALKLTTAAYYTRNGNNINKIGITPDIVEEFDQEAWQTDGTDSQLEKAIEVVEEEGE